MSAWCPCKARWQPCAAAGHLGTRKARIAASGAYRQPRLQFVWNLVDDLALARCRALDILDRGHDPLPNGAPGHVAALQHGVGTLGSLQGGAGAVLAE